MVWWLNTSDIKKKNRNGNDGVNRNDNKNNRRGLYPVDAYGLNTSFDVIVDHSADQAPPSPMTDITSSGWYNSDVNNKIKKSTYSTTSHDNNDNSSNIHNNNDLTSKSNKTNPAKQLVATSFTSKTADDFAASVPINTLASRDEEEGHDTLQQQQHVKQEAENPMTEIPLSVEYSFYLKRCFRDIRHDFKTCIPSYLDDWIISMWKISDVGPVILRTSISSAMAQIVGAIVLADLLHEKTNGTMGTTETFLATGGISIFYACFSGQPLVLVGLSGPVVILLGHFQSLTKALNVAYFPFLFWACIWAGLLHIIAASTGIVSLINRYLSLFTLQVFELYIATTYVYDATRRILWPFFLKSNNDSSLSIMYASLMFATLTFFISWKLHFAQRWIYFTNPIRCLLSSYNTVLAVIFVTAVSFTPGIDPSKDVTIITNGYINDASKDISNTVTSSNNVIVDDEYDMINSLQFSPLNWSPSIDRKWITDPLDGIGVLGIFGALLPGIFFFILFLIQHNACSLLTQQVAQQKFPNAYSWDFLFVGLTFIPCAVLGLPPCVGVIPQATLHARSVCTMDYKPDENSAFRQEVVANVFQQRWSGLGQAIIFVLVMLFGLDSICSYVPSGCLYGVLLYLGVVTTYYNPIWERFALCFVIVSKRPQFLLFIQNVKWHHVRWYTFVQLVMILILFGITQYTDFGYLFPILLFGLILMRFVVITRLFPEETLKHLDSKALCFICDDIENNDDKKLSPHRGTFLESDDVLDYQQHQSDGNQAGKAINRHSSATDEILQGHILDMDDDEDEDEGSIDFLRHPYHRRKNPLHPPNLPWLEGHHHHQQPQQQDTKHTSSLVIQTKSVSMLAGAVTDTNSSQCSSSFFTAAE